MIDDWEPWMAAIEQGLPAPPEAATPEPDESALEPDPEEPRGDAVWREEDGSWWTNFPPPAGFDDEEDFAVEDPFYRRRLSEAEQAVMDAAAVEALTEQRAGETARRDRWFGCAGGTREPLVFSAWEAETYGTSVHLPDEADEAEAPRPGSDFPGAHCETPAAGVDAPRPRPRVTMP